MLNNNDLQQQPIDFSLQSSWDLPLIQNAYQNLLSKQTSPVEQARLKAVASEHSSEWLNAAPVASLGLKLDNNSLRVSVALRLGTKICESHKCICGQLVDPWGRHGLSCKNAKGTHSRHAHVNDLIKRGKRALASCGVPSMHSVAHLL